MDVRTKSECSCDIVWSGKTILRRECECAEQRPGVGCRVRCIDRAAESKEHIHPRGGSLEFRQEMSAVLPPLLLPRIATMPRAVSSGVSQTRRIRGTPKGQLRQARIRHIREAFEP